MRPATGGNWIAALNALFVALLDQESNQERVASKQIAPIVPYAHLLTELKREDRVDLNDIRRYFAEEIRAVANIRSEALVDAFAKVPRERFLGPGPWQIQSDRDENYRTTKDADPRRLYHNILVAIDPGRRLNNGQPSYLAFCIDSLDLAEGDRVLHVGCGVGYYTAIMAEVVGTSGQVTGVEIDADLASRARENLAYLRQAKVAHGDGGKFDPGPCNAIFINAGVTRPSAVWLDSLLPGGRLILYLTVAFDDGGSGRGFTLKVKREDRGYTAQFLSGVSVFHCIGSRDEEANQRLREAFMRGALGSVQSLRRDGHESSDTCWLHGDGFCLSTLLVSEDP
jgi:protein-L-isoaspartate(D-aspartate) O-methyltransferase